MTPHSPTQNAWEIVECDSWSSQDVMLLGLLDEQFDAVYESLLDDELIDLSDELQQRLRTIVLREMLQYFAKEGSETVCAILDGHNYEPLRELLSDRIGRHLLQTDVLDRVAYNPDDPIVLVHVGLRALRDGRK